MGSWGSKKSRIIIVGLDNSGKTTLINSLKPDRVLRPHKIVRSRKTWTSCPLRASVSKASPRTRSTSRSSICQARASTGLCGNSTIRRPRQVHVVTVVGSYICRGLKRQVQDADSEERARPAAFASLYFPRAEFMVAIAARPIPILFYANKMDIPSAFTEGEVTKELQIELIKDRPWNIL